MGPGAHKGVDYVAGEFGPQSRVDTRRLQLRWFDHYLLGKDNGVDREPPVDIFVFGDNAWRQGEGVAARARACRPSGTCRRAGTRTRARATACSTRCRRRGAPADTFTYDPANPTPFLIDSRELETSLNEDYTALNASRARRAGVHLDAAHASRSR